MIFRIGKGPINFYSAIGGKKKRLRKNASCAGSKTQTIHSWGAATHFQIGRALAFKTHGPTTMRMFGLPGDVVMTTAKASGTDSLGLF